MPPKASKAPRHQMGIHVLGPDVNESHPDFGVNAKGEIRYGLMAIKGLGEAAAIAIVQEREKNGPYKDVFDFVQRVSLPAVTKSGLECLALSGACCHKLRGIMSL